MGLQFGLLDGCPWQVFKHQSYSGLVLCGFGRMEPKECTADFLEAKEQIEELEDQVRVLEIPRMWKNWRQ